MTTIKGTETSRAPRPTSRRRPPRHSTVPARAACRCGSGMFRVAKLVARPIEVHQLALAGLEKLPAPIEADDQENERLEVVADGGDERTAEFFAWGAGFWGLLPPTKPAEVSSRWQTSRCTWAGPHAAAAGGAARPTGRPAASASRMRSSAGPSAPVVNPVAVPSGPRRRTRPRRSGATARAAAARVAGQIHGIARLRAEGGPLLDRDHVVVDGEVQREERKVGLQDPPALQEGAARRRVGDVVGRERGAGPRRRRRPSGPHSKRATARAAAVRGARSHAEAPRR